MWIPIKSEDITIDWSRIKRISATLEGTDVQSPVREVRISFDWDNVQIRLYGDAAQQLWNQVLEWNQQHPDSGIPVSWHGTPRSDVILRRVT